eukprot:TRINITY_DN12122_c0_g1_i1.p1 TRINITY_DN12122_c0_g1~~TRINITY_DN12122_c0_g1_i1.p1  ORF type:complete len:115 (-),score=1.82 TRINITY_DN12122_c0_g1_i1:86-430(-)
MGSWGRGEINQRHGYLGSTHQSSEDNNEGARKSPGRSTSLNLQRVINYAWRRGEDVRWPSDSFLTAVATCGSQSSSYTSFTCPAAHGRVPRSRTMISRSLQLTPLFDWCGGLAG